MYHLSNLSRLYINLHNYDNYIGVVTDLDLKLPQNLQFLYLDYFIMNTFPNFANFNQLKQVEMYFCIIKNDNASFVSSTLPANLQYLNLSEMYGFSGELDFRSLMPHSRHLTYIYLHPSGDTTFQGVDFRGINDNTYVWLSSDIGCTASSVYGNNNSVSSIENYVCLHERTDEECTGEKECVSTCFCFEIPQDWQPALNDFYTYV